MGLFSSAKDRAKIRALQCEVLASNAACVAIQMKFNALKSQWNDLVTRINAKGGEAFLARGVSPDRGAGSLTQDEITQMLKLCHPDRHGNSEAANKITRRLLELRK